VKVSPIESEGGPPEAPNRGAATATALSKHHNRANTQPLLEQPTAAIGRNSIL
jgi:hypothetical protein